MADPDGLVELSLDSSTGTPGVRAGELDYTLGLIDPDAIRRPPSTDGFAESSSASVRLQGGQLDRALRAAGMVNDHVTLGVDPDAKEFYVAATGDTDDVRFEVPASDCGEFRVGDARATFSLDYLTAINRALPANGPVDLSLGTDAPVEPGFEFADGSGGVDYAVAPRRVVGR